MTYANIVFMRMLFHANELSETGTITSMLEYAHWFAKRGHYVGIAYDQNSRLNNGQAIKHFQELFDLYPYSNFYTLYREHKGKFDFAYFIKAGEYDGKLLTGAKNAVHAVFQSYEPHGDSYAYVSKWIATMMARDQQKFLPQFLRRKIPNVFTRLPDVPHFVNLPPRSSNLRSDWGIPEDAFVVLRYGSYTTFDIEWVQRAVMDMIDSNPELYFVFINTRPFALHKRIKYLPIAVEKQYKSDALASSDAFLHARAQGECFSMALLEAMTSTIPILSWSGGVDRGHTLVLDSNCFYESKAQLEKKMKFLLRQDRKRYLHSSMDEYSEEKVMYRFTKVFIEE